MLGEPVDYGPLRTALRNLELRHQEVLALPADTPPETRDLYDESLHYRFEVCYERLWGTLLRYLRAELGVDAPLVPIRILRVAGEAGVMPGTANGWRSYITARVRASHKYNAELALAALPVVPDFIRDAVALYENITGEAWA